MQRFTPRKPGSNWSKINVEKVARLKEAGADAAGGHGRVREALGGQDRRVLVRARGESSPPEYEERLRANAAAAEYFDSRPPWYRRTAIHLVMSAKREETRERRLEQLIEDSAAGRDIKQLRR